MGGSVTLAKYYKRWKAVSHWLSTTRDGRQCHTKYYKRSKAVSH